MSDTNIERRGFAFYPKPEEQALLTQMPAAEIHQALLAQNDEGFLHANAAYDIFYALAAVEKASDLYRSGVEVFGVDSMASQTAQALLLRACHDRHDLTLDLAYLTQICFPNGVDPIVHLFPGMLEAAFIYPHMADYAIQFLSIKLPENRPGFNFSEE